MKIKPLRLPGTYEILFEPRRDERGYFLRVYDEAGFADSGLTTAWAQENQAFSLRKGIVRGLHFQKPPFAEAKFVRVVAGRIVDVFLDLRRGSATYGQWDMVELNEEEQKAVYIPKGFAHGYCTLRDASLVLYKVDCRYTPEAEGGIRWNDPDLKIPWPAGDPLVSGKDAKLPLFRDFVTPFA
jgi:dTDP-4-dehydrorhamnose 3,5-epimerase